MTERSEHTAASLRNRHSSENKRPDFSTFQELEKRRSEMLTLIETETQVIKNLVDASGASVAPKLIDFILKNPHFDRIQVMGIPGSGKTAASIELNHFLQSMGYQTILNPFDPIHAQLIDYFGANTKFWSTVQYAYLSYLHSCISFVPEYQSFLDNPEKLDAHYHTFAALFRDPVAQLESFIDGSNKHLYASRPDLRSYPEEFRNFAYMVLSAEMAELGVDVRQLREHVTVEELVGAPRGWIRDRGFMSVLLDSARELDRRRNVVTFLTPDQVRPLERSSFTLMIFPDFKNFQFTTATRREALLSSDENYHTLKQRLLKIGLDVGYGFDHTTSSGKVLAQIMSDMAPLQVVEGLRQELIDEAHRWFERVEVGRPQVSKQDSVDAIRLPKSMQANPDYLVMKECIAYLEEILFKDLKRHPDSCSIGINPFIKGTKSVDLQMMPRRQRAS